MISNKLSEQHFLRTRTIKSYTETVSTEKKIYAFLFSTWQKKKKKLEVSLEEFVQTVILPGY